METSEVLTEALGRIRQWVHSAVADLEEEGLNFRPDEAANSIGWLVWHLTRVQDDHIAHLADRRQVYVADGWADRLGLAPAESDTGYGHTSEQVAAVKVSTPEHLIGCYDAVHERSLEYLTSIDALELDRVVDTNWDPPVTAGVRLVSVIDDCMNHTGQAHYVRGMWERSLRT